MMLMWRSVNPVQTRPDGVGRGRYVKRFRLVSELITLGFGLLPREDSKGLEPGASAGEIRSDRLYPRARVWVALGQSRVAQIHPESHTEG